jgi:hypothetical protein
VVDNRHGNLRPVGGRREDALTDVLGLIEIQHLLFFDGDITKLLANSHVCGWL